MIIPVCLCTAVAEWVGLHPEEAYMNRGGAECRIPGVGYLYYSGNGWSLS